MAKPTAKDPWKAKEWYNILAPSIFGSQSLGETPAEEESSLLGRTITVTQRELTGDFKKSYIKMTFKVNEIKGKDLETEFFSHEVSRSYLRSQVKRRNTKIQAIVDVKTKDARVLRVTVAGFCFRKTTDAQEKSIRKLLSDMLVSKGEEYDLKQYILELLVVGNIIKDAMTKIKEIYPLKRIEIIKTRVLA